MSEKPFAAFTPGPWRIEGTRGDCPIISAGTNSYGDGPQDYVGVLSGMWGRPKPEDVALVLAAPDLLEALQNILAVHDGEGGTRYHAGDIARAAIAKALGSALSEART